jgi:hypothetical protein
MAEAMAIQKSQLNIRIDMSDGLISNEGLNKTKTILGNDGIITPHNSLDYHSDLSSCVLSPNLLSQNIINSQLKLANTTSNISSSKSVIPMTAVGGGVLMLAAAAYCRWWQKPSHSVTVAKRNLFKNFLRELKEILQDRLNPAPTCFISYAWEENDPAATKALQRHLIKFQKHLEMLGGKSSVFLDVTHMDGNMRKRMRDGIENSNCVFLIGTPQYKKRAATDTAVAYEYKLVMQKWQRGEGQPIPLLYSGKFETSFPDESALGSRKKKLSPSMKDFLIRDGNPEAYYTIMAGLKNPLGIIPSLYQYHTWNDNDKKIYGDLWKKYEGKIMNVVKRSSTVNSAVPANSVKI